MKKYLLIPLLAIVFTTVGTIRRYIANISGALVKTLNNIEISSSIKKKFIKATTVILKHFNELSSVFELDLIA